MGEGEGRGREGGFYYYRKDLIMRLAMYIMMISMKYLEKHETIVFHKKPAGMSVELNGRHFKFTCKTLAKLHT